MFTLSRLMAALGAVVVVPTIAYVMGQTLPPPPPPPPPPAASAPSMPPPPPAGGQPGNPGGPMPGGPGPSGDPGAGNPGGAPSGGFGMPGGQPGGFPGGPMPGGDQGNFGGQPGGFPGNGPQGQPGGFGQGMMNGQTGNFAPNSGFSGQPGNPSGSGQMPGSGMQWGNMPGGESGRGPGYIPPMGNPNGGPMAGPGGPAGSAWGGPGGQPGGFPGNGPQGQPGGFGGQPGFGGTGTGSGQFGPGPSGQPGMNPGNSGFSGQPTSTATQGFGNQSNTQFTGPSQEDFEKQEAAREEEMKKQEERMNKQRLDGMKRGLRGVEQGIQMVRKQMTRLVSKGITIPEAAQKAVTEVEGAIATIKKATAWGDEVEAAMDVLSDKGEELRDIGPQLGILEQWPRMVKDNEKLVKNLRSQFKRAQAKAKRSKLDTSAIVAKVDSELRGVEQAFAQAVSLGKAGKYDEAAEMMDDNVYGPSEDLNTDLRVLDNIANASRMFLQAENIIRSYERQSAALKKEKKDTTQLDTLIGDMKQKLADARELIKSANFAPEELFDMMSEGQNLDNDAREEINKLRGKASAFDQKFQLNTAPQINFDAQVFQRTSTGPSSTESSGFIAP